MHRLVVLFQQWRHLFLLFALSALLIVQPIAVSFELMESLFDTLLVLVMAILALTLAKDSVWRVVACILFVPAAIFSLGGYFPGLMAQDISVSYGHLIGAVFFTVVAVKIVRSIFASHELSLDSVFGAICGYLLLGVAWGLTYAAIDAANPEAFQFSDDIRPYHDRNEFRNHIFLYYSFVTLTTVGYGDVSPVSIPARTFSWVEALTGQLYVAVLIAGLISALVGKRISGAYQQGSNASELKQQDNNS